MILLSALCIGIGVFPAPLYALLPYPVDFVPYTGGHVVSQLQLLLFSGLAFFLMLGWLKRTRHHHPRRRLVLAAARPERSCRDLDGRFRRAWAALAARGRERGAKRRSASVYRHHGPQGILARAWPTGSMALLGVSSARRPT